MEAHVCKHFQTGFVSFEIGAENTTPKKTAKMKTENQSNAT